LAVPFSRQNAEHIKQADKQATSASSKFLEACRKFNGGEIQLEELVKTTIERGFANVIDAFHVVNGADVPTRFFVDERGPKGGITLTDEFFALKAGTQQPNFPIEIEARWRLVETAWGLGLSSALLQVQHDPETERLFLLNVGSRRKDVTSAREALSGYQKGKCFYCFRDISLVTIDSIADIDHFLPSSLELRSGPSRNINGLWNLVLACRSCNRGETGTLARVPRLKYLERLHKRNSFLIDSHHPLRETLMAQSGTTDAARRQFLQQQYSWAKSLLIHDWAPVEEWEAVF
jgi:5-methylcytosine-specific restriction endonuclease McrA